MKLDCFIQIFILMGLSGAKEQINDDYLQRIEKIRKLVNEPKFPLKTKKYKCIEVYDSNTSFEQKDDLLSDRKTNIYRSGTLPYERSKLRRVSPTSYVKPWREKNMQQSVSKVLNQTPIRTSIEAPPAVYATGFPRARAIPSPRTHPKVVAQNTIRGVMAASNSKPPLILSPEHCTQIKYYADVYGVNDVLGWVKKNCSFAKMYLPDATCEEINILVASCNLENGPKY